MSSPSQVESIFFAALDLKTAEERAGYLARACGADPALRLRVERLLRAHSDAADFLAQPAVDRREAAALDPSTNAPRGPEELQTVADSTNVPVAGEARPQATVMRTSGCELDPPPVSITALHGRNPGAEILIAGRYTLQEKIGEGGMGEVWVARQSEPVKRKVALKLIKPGMDSRAVLRRFEQERQALAMMDHPNIAKVLDAGMTPNGQPFFAMELVNGLPLNKFCDEARLATRDRLELFVTICHAVQHAHQKGIVHRDLKPSNILITIIDGRPVPKVIDFGVAKAAAGKLTDDSLSTQFGAIVGTLEYMSPEQAGFSGEDIDTRADIYSLGVILYEMLTGLRPIDAGRLKKAALTEMIRIIREEEPSKPSTRLSTDEALPSMAALRQVEPRRLMALLRGELDWVVMKCLEKRRDRRYETANGLARDVQRFLDDEAVEARPPSVGYRMGKFLKRNRGPALAASFVLLALVTGFIGTAWGLFRADRARRAEAAQRRIAVEEKTKAEASEALARARRTRAEEREEQAIDAVKRFRDAVADNPELKSNPALEPLRKVLLKEPLAFFKALRDRLQADRDTRPESLARLARASFDLGALSDEIGDKQDALIAYRECLAILQALADANPAVAEFRRNLAATHTNMGTLLRATGKPDEALEAHEAALAILQKLADANPAVTEFRRKLSHSHFNIGLLLRDASKPAEALKAYEAALAIQQELADANPTVTAFRSDLARCHLNIGLALRDVGKLDEALQAYEAALAIQQELADANPTVTRFQSEMAHCHNNIGALLRDDVGKPAEALKAHEAALAIRRKLADANPTVTAFRSDLALSYGNIGISLSEIGKPAEALKAHEAALAIWQPLADANPTVTRFRRELAFRHKNIGNMLSEIGKPAEALKAHEAALAILEQLTREPTEFPFHASALGALLDNVATIDYEAGRFDAARERLLRAITWQRKALTANPRNPQYRQFLAHHLNCLIRAARGLGDAEGSAEAERDLAKLRDSDPAMAVLDARLSAVVKGDQKPKDNANRLQIAQRAYDKRLYATAARLWAEALAADPKLGDDRGVQHRYNAACAAALAASGNGKDDPPPDDAVKAKLRRQALDWLKAELTVWSKVLDSGPSELKAVIAPTLKHWKADADLAGVRDEKELAKLPHEEQATFQKLWNDVDQLLARAPVRK